MNRKIGRKPDRKIPVPRSGLLIVLTGLEHMENGKSLGRQLAFCTGTQDGGAFFLSPEDMVSPTGDEALAAQCGVCEVTHWIVDLRTAAHEGELDTGPYDAGVCLDNVELLKNLPHHGCGSAASRAAVRKRRIQTRVAS
jgi:hypothetical protein